MTEVKILYTDHKELSWRRIIPDSVKWGHLDWLPDPVWVLRAFDLDKKEYLYFALSHIKEWKEVQPSLPKGIKS